MGEHKCAARPGKRSPRARAGAHLRRRTAGSWRCVRAELATSSRRQTMPQLGSSWVDRLQPMAVWIEHERGVVGRAVVGAKAWPAIVTAARAQGSGVEAIHGI